MAYALCAEHPVDVETFPLTHPNTQHALLEVQKLPTGRVLFPNQFLIVLLKSTTTILIEFIISPGRKQLGSILNKGVICWNRWYETHSRLRDVALLAVALGCGLHRSEIVSLTFEQSQKCEGR